MKITNVSVFGIGYVGAVSAACIAQTQRHVIAVDPNMDKVNSIRSGSAPIFEPGLDALTAEVVRGGLLTATTSADDAISSSDLSLVCVGTPSRADGSLDTQYVELVAQEIGAALKAKIETGGTFHSVVMRSTILPGTMKSIVIPLLEEASGYRAGVDFGVGYFPEFLRESSAIKDFHDPGAVVFGASDATTEARLRELNAHADVEPRVMDISACEAVKYANNIWHAIKICYANEIGNVCAAQGIDSHEVMNAVCADTRLNISPAYMKPGFAFGGSCLPKDMRAMRHRARDIDVATPLMDAAMEANERQLERAYEMVRTAGKKRVGFVGLSFKPGTDDLRESPLLDLAERLHGRGYHLKIYDTHVQDSSRKGVNTRYLNRRVPNMADMFVDSFDDLSASADTIVVGAVNGSRESLIRTLEAADKDVVDLVRLAPTLRSQGRYQGICW